jgi:uncharacterized membrane protein
MARKRLSLPKQLNPGLSNSIRRPRRALRDINISEPERIVTSIGGAALALYGLGRRDMRGLAMALAGSYLLYRGATGHCHTYKAMGVNMSDPSTHGGIKVSKSIVIRRSAEDLYEYWYNFENLPQFMEHLQAVWMIGDHRWHWVAKAPAGMDVEWDADVIDEREGEFIAWQSLEGSDVPNEGSVSFRELPNDQGTQVTVNLIYYPLGGQLGAWIAMLFGEEPSMQIEDDLRNFKLLMEDEAHRESSSSRSRRNH